MTNPTGEAWQAGEGMQDLQVRDVRLQPYTRLEIDELVKEMVQGQLGSITARLDRLDQTTTNLQQLRMEHDALKNSCLKLRGRLAVLEENGVPASPAGDRLPKMKMPDAFEGDRTVLQDWLDQITLYQYGTMRSSPEHAKVAFTLSLLRGSALKWAKPIIDDLNSSTSYLTHDDLVQQLKNAFSEVDAPAVAADKMLSLRQGSSTVADYAAKFRQYKSQSGWGKDNTAYASIFRKGLSPAILQHIAGQERKAESFDDYVNWVTKVDEQMRIAGSHSRGGGSSQSHAKATPRVQATTKNPDAMDVDKAKRFNGNCFTCGESGHQSRHCKSKKPPARAATATVEEVATTSSPSPEALTSAIKAMIDQHLAAKNHEWRSNSSTSTPSTASTPSSESSVSSQGF